MKLQSGIVFNCKNGAMSGFVTDNNGVYSLSTVTKDTIKDIKEYKQSKLKSMNSPNCLPTNPKSTNTNNKSSKKDENGKSNEHDIATYVNLYRVQSMNRVSCNLDFFIIMGA